MSPIAAVFEQNKGLHFLLAVNCFVVKLCLRVLEVSKRANGAINMTDRRDGRGLRGRGHPLDMDPGDDASDLMGPA
jgi:hypothetical protein